MKPKILKGLAISSFGGLAYGLTEIIVRGFTHISMGLLGGIAMLVIHLLNDQRREGTNYFALISVSGAFITSMEFLTGEILNGAFGMNIWDYSEVPLNFDGQICLPFAFLWILLSAVGVAADDFMRWKMFGEEKNFYRFIRKKQRTAA